MIMQESKWSRPGPRGIGPTRRRSTCEKDHAGVVCCKRDRARERKRKQRDTASEESKAKEKV